MKKLLIFTGLLIIMFGLSAQGNRVKTTDYFMIQASVLDTAGVTEQHAESVHVMTYFKGFECIDAWYLAADDQCQTINGELMFFDQYGDLDADSGNGCYYLRYAFIDTGGTLYHKGDYYFELGLFGDTAQVNVAEAGDAMTLTAGERQAIADTNQARLDLSGKTIGTVTSVTNPVTANMTQIHGSAAAADSLEKTVLGTLADYGNYQGAAGDNSPSAWDATDSNIVAFIVWDEILTGATHNVATSAGRRLRQLETGQILLTGTINTANDSTATLGLSGAYDDEFFTHTWLVVTTGIDTVQIRAISDYTGATDSIDMAAGEAWVVVPSNGDEWEIVANAGVHVVDLHQPVLDQISTDIANDTIPVDAAKISGDATAATNLQALQGMSARAGAVNDGSPDFVDFDVDGFTEATNDHFNSMIMVFTSGVLRGQAKIITDYVGSTQNMIFADAWTEAPANNDEFVIVPAGMANIRLWREEIPNALLSNSVDAHVTELGANVITSAAINTDAITATGIATDAIGASELATDAVDEIWEYDTSSVSAGMGEMLKDTSAYQGSASGLTKGDIADTLKKTPLIMQDTLRTGDTLAVKKDSLIYQGVGQDSASTDNIIDLALADYGVNAGKTDYALSNAANEAIADSVLKDSLSYQGSASGLSAAEVADTLTNRGMSTGGGTEAETLIVLNSADSTAIQDARPQVYTLNQVTGKVTTLTTDVNGVLICFLGDGVGTDSFFVRTTANNYVQITDTVAVASGGGTDTLWMTQFNPGSPSAPEMCILYVDAESFGDVAIEKGKLSVTPDRAVTDSTGTFRPVSTLIAYTDSTGYASVEVLRSSQIKYPANKTLRYTITFEKKGFIKAIRLQYNAPDSANHRIIF